MKCSAGDEVFEYAKLNPDQYHYDFVVNAYAIINKKYYYRFWLIISYDGATIGDEYHEVNNGPYAYHWFRDANRCVFMTSTNNAENIGPRLNKCIEEKKNEERWYKAANLVWEDLKSCLETFNGLMVIRTDIDKIWIQTGGAVVDVTVTVVLQRMWEMHLG